MLRRLVLSALLFPIVAGAQSQQEFAARRAAIVGPLSDGVLVALGAHEPAQDYVGFVQSPSFYYLTGFKEPDAALVVVKQGGQVVSSTMFVQPRLPSREVWTGARTGVEGIATSSGMKGRDVADHGEGNARPRKGVEHLRQIGDVAPLHSRQRRDPLDARARAGPHFARR